MAGFDTSDSDLVATLNPSSGMGDTLAAGSGVPSYWQGADNHNIGNGNFSVTSPSTWLDGLSSAGKLAVTSVASGVNSFWNTGVTVANWFGADAKENDIGATLAGIDSDLGQYYAENKQAADLVGFALTSFIPGVAGVKILNAGQRVLRGAQETGLIGTNLSRFTGLLTPSVETYTKLAAVDIAKGNLAFGTITSNSLKAIGAGYAQATLESAAFETAVAATMFKSPVLEDQDGVDIAKNIMSGAFVGGVIGGAISHAVTTGTIKRAAASINPVEKLFSADASTTGLSAAESLIARQARLSELPQAPTKQQILSGEFKGLEGVTKGLPADAAEEAANALSTKFTGMRTATVRNLENGIKTDIRELVAGKDGELASQVSDIVANSDSIQNEANFKYMQQMGRIGTKLDAEKLIAKNAKNLVDLSDNAPAPASASLHIGYVPLVGEDAGKMGYQAPTVLSIADTASSIDDVLKTVNGYKFRGDRVWDGLKDNLSANEAEARQIWVDRSLQIQEGMKIGAHDIPTLEKVAGTGFLNPTVAEDGTPIVKSVNVINPDKSVTPITSGKDLWTHIQLAKDEVIDKLSGGVTASTNRSTDEIAKIANVKRSYLEGEVNSDPFQDLFARQVSKDTYVAGLKKSGTWTQEKEDNFALTPKVLKVSYDVKPLTDANGMVLDGMAHCRARQKIYQQTIDNVFANEVPSDLRDQFYHPTDEQLLATTREGGGPRLFKSANGNYDSPESFFEFLGSSTSRLQTALKAETSGIVNPVAYRLAQNQEAAIEFETIGKKISSSGEQYGFNQSADGSVSISPLKWIDYQEQQARLEAGEKLKDGERLLKEPKFAEGTELEIPMNTPEAIDAWQTRTQLTGDKTKSFQDIRNAQGYTDMKDFRALRPVRPDPKDYPHFAMVIDDSVTGVGHKSMIHAATANDLDSLIAKVPSNYTVLKKSELEAHFHAEDVFDYEKTLHENYINSDLKSKGVNNPFFIKTDPQKIAQDLLNDHLKSDDILARELVNAKYEKEFQFLRQQGDQFTATAASKYTGSYKSVEGTVDNPYLNYIKMGLNISQQGEHPILSGLNTILDSAFSKASRVIGDALGSTKSVADLTTVNSLLDKYGVKSAYYDSALQLLANHTAPKGDLIQFVRNANAILSALVIRTDPMNAANNFFGANVLYGAETSAVLKAMQRGDTSAVGRLADANLLQIPGMQDSIQTPWKLYAQSLKNMVSKDAVTASGEKLDDFYKRLGFDTSLQKQIRSVMDDFTLEGTESVKDLNSRMQSAFGKVKDITNSAEKWSGNSFAEHANRFIAADTMRQITDAAVSAGKISQQEQFGFINSFVNRTQGNIIASQRPLMFQGPVGQAVGLFQSYQFNMLQQLFRHVSEGAPKDAAMLLGLQGTMYGMNGLPAFSMINQHILGTLSGNKEHTDAYSATYGAVGKQVGDWLLYGAPSNLLHANLYTRGDINPRQVTIIPVNPADIPIVTATTKAFTDVKDTLGSIANGGNVWQAVLQGIEHNGLSRPMAGIAQSAQALTSGGYGFSTSGKGNISAANDLFSLATAARLAGAKPFDESVVNDAAFRFSAYQMADQGKRDVLDRAIKTTLIAGGEPTADQINSFTASYAATGGSQVNFNKHMMNLFKDSNTSQANKIIEHLKKPYAQNFQQVMGGRELLDGNDL